MEAVTALYSRPAPCSPVPCSKRKSDSAPWTAAAVLGPANYLRRCSNSNCWSHSERCLCSELEPPAQAAELAAFAKRSAPIAPARCPANSSHSAIAAFRSTKHPMRPTDSVKERSTFSVRPQSAMRARCTASDRRLEEQSLCTRRFHARPKTIAGAFPFVPTSTQSFS